MGASSGSVKKEIRCQDCGRLIGEYLDEVEIGRVTILIRCRHCERIDVTVIKGS